MGPARQRAVAQRVRRTPAHDAPRRREVHHAAAADARDDERAADEPDRAARGAARAGGGRLPRPRAAWLGVARRPSARRRRRRSRERGAQPEDVAAAAAAAVAGALGLRDRARRRARRCRGARRGRGARPRPRRCGSAYGVGDALGRRRRVGDDRRALAVAGSRRARRAARSAVRTETPAVVEDRDARWRAPATDVRHSTRTVPGIGGRLPGRRVGRGAVVDDERDPRAPGDRVGEVGAEGRETRGDCARLRRRRPRLVTANRQPITVPSLPTSEAGPREENVQPPRRPGARPTSRSSSGTSWPRPRALPASRRAAAAAAVSTPRTTAALVRATAAPRRAPDISCCTVARSRATRLMPPKLRGGRPVASATSRSRPRAAGRSTPSPPADEAGCAALERDRSTMATELAVVGVRRARSASTAHAVAARSVPGPNALGIAPSSARRVRDEPAARRAGHAWRRRWRDRRRSAAAVAVAAGTAGRHRKGAREPERRLPAGERRPGRPDAGPGRRSRRGRRPSRRSRACTERGRRPRRRATGARAARRRSGRRRAARRATRPVEFASDAPPAVVGEAAVVVLGGAQPGQRPCRPRRSGRRRAAPARRARWSWCPRRSRSPGRPGGTASRAWRGRPGSRRRRTAGEQPGDRRGRDGVAPAATQAEDGEALAEHAVVGGVGRRRTGR